MLFRTRWGSGRSVCGTTLKKAHFRALGALRTRNRPFLATLVAPWARTGGEPVKPCWGRPFGL